MKRNCILWFKVLLSAILCIGSNLIPLYAQMRVGQPAGSPDGSAALDVSGGPYSSGSPYRGLLPPKVALTQTTQAAPVTAPATGLLVYNTAKVGDVTPGYYYWEGSKWARFNTTSSAGSARIATAGGGQFIKAFLLADLSTSAFTSPYPDHFILVDSGKEGLFRFDATDTSTPDNGGTVLVTAGKRYKRVYEGGINVKWFGAKGDGNTDDRNAIQQAVDYAKFISVANGGDVRTEVVFPSGIYRVDGSPIAVTNLNGVFLKGSSGRYMNVHINGNTGAQIFDFSGSTMSGCEGFTFISSKKEPTPSTIGVQFALTQDSNGKQIGGLNCIIKNCYFRMDESPTVNGGLGTIALLNCRAEEFSVHDIVTNSTVGMLFTSKANLSDLGIAYSVASPSVMVATGTGSMGVVSMSNISLQNVTQRRAALILVGTNSINWKGAYMSRVDTAGTGKGNAIEFVNQNDNINIQGTVESFGTIAKFGSIGNTNITLKIITANHTNKTLPVFDATGAKLHDCELKVSFGNEYEYNTNGRIFMYHASVDNGNSPATGYLKNCSLYCGGWNDPTTFVSQNILKNSANCNFNCGQSFKKDGEWVRKTYHYNKPLGTVTGSTVTAIIAGFSLGDKATKTSANGGAYVVKVSGLVQVGGENSGGNVVMPIELLGTISQNANGNLNTFSSQGSPVIKSLTVPSYLDITALNLIVDFTTGRIKLAILVTGTGIGELITFTGDVSILNTFTVNDSVIFDTN